jgi:hypothetical protein
MFARLFLTIAEKIDALASRCAIRIFERKSASLDAASASSKLNELDVAALISCHQRILLASSR